jgi:molybdenum-dependent DNA-binding transcriptional regulator ModE
MAASACRHADMIHRLEELLSDRLVSAGSAGQPRLSAAVTELRQSRLALSRLLTDLALPVDDVGEDGEAVPVKLASPASRRASHAATARHDRDRRRQTRTAGEV